MLTISIGLAHNLRTPTGPIQQSFRQRSIGHALRINASRSEFFHGLIKKESDASRLLSLERFSFVTIALSPTLETAEAARRARYVEFPLNYRPCA